MADGTTKAIEDVAVGDLVRGLGGAANRVTAIETPLLGSRPLYDLNGGPFFVTASHPFHTADGLKSIDPAATAREPRQLRVGMLTTGDEILGDWEARDERGTGSGHHLVTVRSIAATTVARETVLYNLRLSGDGSHQVGGLFEVLK
ncbi:MAG: hypothetical protein ACR2OO_13995 [Thermomicrobiales bacterium]